MGRQQSRRKFLRNATLASAGYWVAGTASNTVSASPNERVNVAIIGCGGQGAGNTDRVNGTGIANIVGLCDVDEARAAGTFAKYPNAKRYKDFRKMLEEMKEIDAVVVSTPDHTHAVAGVMAMKLGKHLYCEKPLTHDVYEARTMREVATKMKVATQMGNHGTAQDSFRRSVEIVQSGVVGQIREAHIWTNRPIWPQGMLRPKEAQPVPKTLDWKLWLGPAADRPYNSAYCPFNWRGWWDFGTGALGDMACHTGNMAFMGLKLGYPTSVEAKTSGVNPDSAPSWSTITYEFPARGDLAPVKLFWYDGKIDGKPNLPPPELVRGLSLSGSGSLLIGERGVIFSPDDYGAHIKVIVDENLVDIKSPPQTLPRIGGQHHREWLEACKGGRPALSNFDYAAFLTEVVVLGNVATRVGKKILWDGPNMKAIGCPEADKYIRYEYHNGYSL